MNLRDDIICLWHGTRRSQVPFSVRWAGVMMGCSFWRNSTPCSPTIPPGTSRKCVWTAPAGMVFFHHCSFFAFGLIINWARGVTFLTWSLKVKDDQSLTRAWPGGGRLTPPPLPNIRDSSKTNSAIDVKLGRPSHTTILHRPWKFFLKSVGKFLRYGRFCDVTTRHFWSKIGQNSRVCGRRSF